MIEELRAWLEAEMKLLANASHHAYSFGQANMAQRALAQIDALGAGKVVLTLSATQAEAALHAFEAANEPGLERSIADLKAAAARS